MLIRLLKNSQRAGYLMLLFMLLALWHQQFVEPAAFSFATGEEKSVLFYPLHLWLGDNLLAKTIITVAILLVNSFVLVRIYRYYLFPGSRSLMAAVIFVVLTGGIRTFHTFHPVWLAVPFLLLAIHRLFASFDANKPYSNDFDAGLLLSVGSLFYIPLLALLPAFMVGGRLLARDAKWREMVLVFLGSLIPWIFTFSIFFILDKTGELITVISDNVISNRKTLEPNLPLLLFIGSSALLTLMGSFLIIRQYDEKKVNFRMFFLLFFFFFVSLVIAFFAIPAVSYEIIILTAVPVTYLLSNYFESIKNGWWGSAIFAALALLVIYLQYAEDELIGFSLPFMFP